MEDLIFKVAFFFFFRSWNKIQIRNFLHKTLNVFFFNIYRHIFRVYICFSTMLIHYSSLFVLIVLFFLSKLIHNIVISGVLYIWVYIFMNYILLKLLQNIDCNSLCCRIYHCCLSVLYIIVCISQSHTSVLLLPSSRSTLEPSLFSVPVSMFCLSFSVWLILLSLTVSRSIHPYHCKLHNFISF